MKKVFYIVAIISLIWFTSIGCATKMLWDRDMSGSKRTYYTDKINSFLVSQNHKKIVFISKTYHYIFENTQTLAYLLSYEGEQEVTYMVNKGNYFVHGDKTWASFYVKIDNNSSSEELLNWAKLNRFTKVDNRSLKKYIKLEGKRYLASKKVNQNVKKLIDPIELRITYESKGSKITDTVSKVVLTPIAVVADGVLIIGAIILSPFAIIIGASSSR